MCELCKNKRRVRVWTSTPTGLINERVQDCPRCSGGPAVFPELPMPIKSPRQHRCEVLPVVTRAKED